jgi:Xaa-Pro aminopeptidase
MRPFNKEEHAWRMPGRFGVRVEDIVVAAEDRGRRLNNTSHEMRIVS